MELLRPEHKTKLEITQEVVVFPSSITTVMLEGKTRGELVENKGRVLDGSRMFTQPLQKKQRVSYCLGRCKEERQILWLLPHLLPISYHCSHWPDWQKIRWHANLENIAHMVASKRHNHTGTQGFFPQSCTLPTSPWLTAKVHSGSKMLWSRHGAVILLIESSPPPKSRKCIWPELESW